MFAHGLEQPTRTASLTSPSRRYRFREQPAVAVPIRFCSRWGLPCRLRCRRRGALLPHLFTLAAPKPRRAKAGGSFSVALSLGSPPPDVIRHRMSMEPGLSSPAAFRHLRERPSGRLTRLGMGDLSRRVKAISPRQARKINYPEDVVWRAARSTGCRRSSRSRGVTTMQYLLMIYQNEAEARQNGRGDGQEDDWRNTARSPSPSSRAAISRPATGCSRPRPRPPCGCVTARP